MSCETNISKNFELDCTMIPVKGVVQSITLINSNDIDRSATVFNATNDQVIESIVLKSGGKKAYLMGGVKNLLNMEVTKVTNEDTFDGWTHSISGYIAKLSPDNLQEIKALTNGAELVAIVRTKEEGVAGDGAFHVLGYDQPLTLGDSAFNANENGGLPIILANKDGYESPQFPYGFYDTDLATTEALVAALLTATV